MAAWRMANLNAQVLNRLRPSKVCSLPSREVIASSAAWLTMTSTVAGDGSGRTARMRHTWWPAARTISCVELSHRDRLLGAGGGQCQHPVGRLRRPLGRGHGRLPGVTRRRLLVPADGGHPTCPGVVCRGEDARGQVRGAPGVHELEQRMEVDALPRPGRRPVPAGSRPRATGRRATRTTSTGGPGDWHGTGAAGGLGGHALFAARPADGLTGAVSRGKTPGLRGG